MKVVMEKITMMTQMGNNQIDDINSSINRYLEIREHSKKELINKLLKKSYPIEDILLCVENFSKQKLQSDERYAEDFVRVKFEAGKGPLFIRESLKSHQVDSEIISKSISLYSKEDWLNKARSVIEKKVSSSKVTREKLVSFLQYRGFPYDMIDQLLMEHVKS